MHATFEEASAAALACAERPPCKGGPQRMPSLHGRVVRGRAQERFSGQKRQGLLLRRQAVATNLEISR
eukprot:1618110-Pyramimonas_sp.AAC.1